MKQEAGPEAARTCADAPVRDIGDSVRARGMRMTPQRRRVIDAVTRLGHSTPDGLAAAVAADGGAALPLSTIYRNLEALEEVGIVSHTHLGHGSPTYHLADHADHLHLVCLACGSVIESDLSAAEPFVGNLRDRHGFVADIRHMAIHGWCARCSQQQTAPSTLASPSTSASPSSPTSPSTPTGRPDRSRAR